MKKTQLFLLVVLAAAQFAVLAAMITGKERVLRDGEEFRFKTRPIDPADPFCGRYVILNLEENHIPLPPDEMPTLVHRQVLYAGIATGTNGFARFSGWSRERPASGPYLKTRYCGEYCVYDQTTKTSIRKGLRIELPFNRFYMDEAKAPRAERIVWDSTSDTNCWAAVRILNGKAVVEDVFAKGRSIRALVAETPAK